MDQNAKTQVAYFEHQRSGCFYYRTKHVMDLLGGKPLQLDQDVLFYDQLKSVQIYGIYPFSFEKVIRQLKTDGIKIIYDVDDAFVLIDPTNPFYHAVRKDVSSANVMFDLADHITVGTPALAEYVRTKTKARITVIPNCYVPGEWVFPRPKREGIRIGFSGSTTHVAGLAEILPTIKELQAKYDIKFLIQGFGSNSYEEWYKAFRYHTSELTAVMELEKLNGLLRSIQFEWVPFVDFSVFPQTLTNMSLDIGICPLQETPFNKCRGASKAMEYTLSGALAIAADTTPYRTDPTSLLYGTLDELYTHIEQFIQHKETYQSIQEQHLDWIKNNRTVESQRDLLENIYLH